MAAGTAPGRGDPYRVGPDERDWAAKIVAEHQFNPKTGNCACGWEPAGNRAETEHGRHIERMLDDWEGR